MGFLSGQAKNGEAEAALRGFLAAAGTYLIGARQDKTPIASLYHAINAEAILGAMRQVADDVRLKRVTGQDIFALQKEAGRIQRRALTKVVPGIGPRALGKAGLRPDDLKMLGLAGWRR